MKNRIGNVLWGLVLIALGVLFCGKFLFDWDIEFFFNGWWTLFIIVPCFISIVQNGFSTGAVVGLIFGVVWFLGCNDVVGFWTAFKLIIPAIFISLGVKLIFRNNFAKKVENIYNQSSTTSYTVDGDATDTSYGPDSIENSDGTKANYQKSNGSYHGNSNGFQTGAEYSAFFSSNRANYDNEVFTGTSVNAIFGGVVIDLRGAIIEQDVVINASAIFGGIDIYVPYGVKVKVNNVPIFGGVSNKAAGHSKADAPTIYLQSTCMFGGIDIK